MRLAKKIPIAAALLTFFAIASTSVVGLVVESRSLQIEVQQKLAATADGRRNEARQYLNGIKLDLTALAANITTSQALFGFSGAWTFLGADPAAELHKRYIDNNPNPIGEKYKLDTAKKDNYDRAHAQYHPIFRQHLQALGYYDTFIFDLQGNVVYTVFKEKDYGTNVINGPWKDTGLAAVYKKALEITNGDDVVFSDFESYAPSSGASSAFMAAPIIMNKRTVGVLAIQMPTDKFNDMFANKVGLGETGQTLLINQNGFIANNAVQTADDDSLKVKLDVPELDTILGGQAKIGELTDTDKEKIFFAAAPLAFAGTTWAVVAEVSKTEALSGLWTSGMITTAMAAIILAGAIFVALVLSRTMTSPIKTLVIGMRQLAGGDTSITLQGEDRKDEIGDMVRSVAVFKQAAVEKRQLEHEAATRAAEAERARVERERIKAAEQNQLHFAVETLGESLQRLSKGDLTGHIETPFSGDIDRLRQDFNLSLDRLAGTISSVQNNTHSMNERVQDVSISANELTRRTTQQAAALQQTSAAVNQIMVALKNSTEKATFASSIAEEAKTSSAKSGGIVSSAVEAMGRIESASAEISQIINVIDEIAFQTNLLALNAGVEAARAGDAGKGFAVVAQEVRELALRSANAAKDIKALISKSGHEVANGVQLVTQTGAALTQIASHVAKIADQIQSIALAAREQSLSLNEINSSMRTMEDATVENGRAAKHTSENMTGLSLDANKLDELMSQFEMASHSGALAGYRNRAA